MKRLIHGATIGVSIGTMISLLFSFIFSHTQFMPVSPISTMGRFYYEHFTELQIMLISVLIWAFLGVTFSLGELIFSHTRLSIFKKTVIHFSVMLIVMFPLGILAGWFPLRISVIIVFILIYTMIYFVIWSIESRRAQRDINEINKIISENQKH